MNVRNLQRLVVAALICGAVMIGLSQWGAILGRTVNNGRKWTVAERVAQYGAAVRERLAPDCARLGLAWPPRAVRLAGFKQERRLEVWVSNDGETYAWLRTYPILGASGTSGPKLREGDRQVPEGVYRIASLNPNSLYHLALRVDYPNAFDREMGRRDGRDQLGGDIMIHGGHLSIGCLAIGNEAIEELFVLAAETGPERIGVVLAPCDLRTVEAPAAPGAPAWTTELYAQVRQELAKLTTPAAPSNTVALCAPAAAAQPKEGKNMDDAVEIYSLAEKKLVRVPRIHKTDAEWKVLLPPDVYRVTRQGGTECAFTGKLYKNKFEGVYRCACCNTDLFVTDAKFESGTGWPSFFQPVHANNVRMVEDRSYGMVRMEVLCGRCDAHLGHVFDDGPPPTGRRYCINSAALRFEAYTKKP